MHFTSKRLMTNLSIMAGTQIGRKFPTLGGVIATMPLTSLLVLLWLYSDNPGDARLMADYTRGVLWGIVPTILFFAVALLCFRRQLPLSLVLSASFGVWLAGAAFHQWLLK